MSDISQGELPDPGAAASMTIIIACVVPTACGSLVCLFEVKSAYRPTLQQSKSPTHHIVVETTGMAFHKGAALAWLGRCEPVRQEAGPSASLNECVIKPCAKPKAAWTCTLAPSLMP
jgi:hypothetical protein